MFNSRDPIYRNPTGAVPQGKNIHFKITLPRDISCSAAYLIMEADQEKTQCLDMFWCGMNGDSQEWWECDFAPVQPGLYFYHFELKTSHGRSHLFRTNGGAAVMHGSDRWQITVYDTDFKTPDWLKGGVMYQIFPDRFYASGYTKASIPDYRQIHEHWEEQPVWQANAQGDITNEDFFGGDLKGIEKKLSYLKELGVSCIYLNPIFEAHSNHRYDTANYEKIDPLLGTEEDFCHLCSTAKQMGIHIIIDGVFSHTGSDSIYFNKEGRYDSPGAYNTMDSPYFSWYNFKKWPTEYDSWWGFETLPNVHENNPEFDNYINGEAGIVRKWLKAGAAGWRLDVADELPDEFLDHLCATVKSESKDAVVLGEVWEDASTKTAYGVRRRYLLGNQLDTVMNYPFREAIFRFLLKGDNTYFFETIESILENYPPCSVHLLMNHIGTHDTERAITMLGGEPVGTNGREWQSRQSLTPRQYQLGIQRLKLASLIQYTLPGVPCLYYGDEAGMEGYKDPFNRGTYPWDKEGKALLSWYQALGAFRNTQPVLKNGSFRQLLNAGDAIGFERYLLHEDHAESLFVILNRGDRIQLLSDRLLPPEVTLVLGTDCRQNNYELPPYGFSVYALRQSLPKGLDAVNEAESPPKNPLSSVVSSASQSKLQKPLDSDMKILDF